MTEPIHDPAYWAKRLEEAKQGHLHHAVFKCSLERWQAIEAKHREILTRLVGPNDCVLDAGCGWGRLVDLFPSKGWSIYRGIDLSLEFIKLARDKYPSRVFGVGDLRALPYKDTEFDWAVLISVRPMVKRNMGQQVWDEMERELRRVCRKLLYLEYDPNDEGSVE